MNPIAAIRNAGLWNRPKGPGWKTASEWAAASKLCKSTTQARLDRLVASGEWERQRGGRTHYYRPTP